MNERMLELYRQSWVPHTDIDPSNNMPYKTTIFSADKFAELIVRECMNICKEHPSRTLSNRWNGDAVAPDIVHRFEEHFGVEE